MYNKPVFAGFFILCFFLLTVQPCFGQNGVAIAATTATADGSAMLDIQSTSKGFLVPRMTTAQRTPGIGLPATGLLVYDITIGAFFYYTGSAWVEISAGALSGSGTVGYDAAWTTTSALGNSNVYNSGTSVGIGTTTAVTNTLTVNNAGTTAGTPGSYPLAIARANTVDYTFGSDAANAYEQSWNSKPLVINLQGNNVGIGVSGPYTKLNIGGNGTALSGNGLMVGSVGAALTLAVAVGVETGRFEIAFPGYRDAEPNQIGAKIASIRRNNYVANSALIQSSDLAFFTGGGITGGGTTTFEDITSERMRIDYTGNVGIGVSAPTAQLHTTGTVRFANYPNGILITDASGNLKTTPLTVTGTVGQVDITNGNGVSGNPTINIDATYTEDLKANTLMTGGGTVTFTGGNLAWTNRFIVISDGYGSQFSTNGYFDISQPASGTTIPYVGLSGGGSATVTASGVPLAAWEALYYILPIGSSNTTTPANFRIAYWGANATFTVPENWVLIAVLNGDDGNLRLGNGMILWACPADILHTTLVAIPAYVF